MTAAPFAHYAGEPRASQRIVFVGEAWGEEEERARGEPFVGSAGREFFRMLGEAFGAPELCHWADDSLGYFVEQRRNWLIDNGIGLTNVLALRPALNNMASVCCSKQELPNDYSLPPIRSEAPRYLGVPYLPELERLRQELLLARPNLVVALGATALWALTGSFAIGTLRGAVRMADRLDLPGQKVLPTYHPAGVLYRWPLRSTVIADLLKAHKEQLTPHIVRPQRQIVVQPTLEDIRDFALEALKAPLLAVDIETFKGQIRCIGFAWARDWALVIPFIRDLKGGHYWTNEEDELTAWGYCREMLESPVPKLFQNGLFDLQYLTRAGIHVRNVAHDTMLLHHVLYPEMPKGLGFLGSIYTNEQAWKPLGRHREELKKDE